MSKTVLILGGIVVAAGVLVGVAVWSVNNPFSVPNKDMDSSLFWEGLKKYVLDPVTPYYHMPQFPSDPLIDVTKLTPEVFDRAKADFFRLKGNDNFRFGAIFFCGGCVDPCFLNSTGNYFYVGKGFCVLDIETTQPLSENAYFKGSDGKINFGWVKLGVERR